MTRHFLTMKFRIAGTVFAFLAAANFSHAQLARKTVDLGNDPAWVKKTALEVDKLVARGFAKSKVSPIAPADDAKWLRRVYLDAIGRIPSYDEAKAFLDDTAADKREQTVTKLLNSEGWVSTTYNWYADILRATSKLGTDGTRSGVPYLRWLRESVATNKPWNKMVYELITTNGGGWEEGKGAVGYFERDRGMPLDNMANTTRIFLGTHIECAQCHDHPYDTWKQKDFYEMSAFTHGLKTGTPKEEQRKYVNEKYNGKTNQDPDKTKRDIYRWLQDNIYDFGVWGDGKGNIMLPADFKGKGGKAGDTVPAKSIYPGASGSKTRDMKDAREEFAEWVTEPQNPRFTLIMVNRIWKRTMGIGLFEPVDKFVMPSKDNSGTAVNNPEVLKYLEGLLKELNYDVKTFQKVLLNTRTYALGTNRDAVDPRAAYVFHGRAVKRMTAEQVWDSMGTLVVPDIDYRKGGALSPNAVVGGRNLGKSVYEVYKEVINMKPAEITAWVDKTVSYGGGKGGGEDMMMMDKSMMASNDAAAANMTDAAKWSAFSKEILRASELSSPTPPQHFLRKFGQSSREVIEGGSSESDVTQVLSLINGHVEKNIVNESRAVVYKAIDAAATPEEKVKAAFIGILTRNPTPAELELMLPEARKGREGIKNILYALLNSNEFIFIL